MLLDFLFKRTTIPLLEKSLDAASWRQRVIATNIANISTPGYKKLKVSFEEDLKRALEERGTEGVVTNPKHIPLGAKRVADVKPRIIRVDGAPLSSGVNNVDIDREMAELVKNQIRYDFAARLIARNFKILKQSIRGRS